MIGKITYTGSSGAGQTLTAQVYNNVTDFEIDMNKQTIRLVADGIQYYNDMSVITTMTVAISAAGGTYTITLS
jgi:hypothetical protein